MDTLVAQYSKPMFEKENYSQDDQMELYQPAPTLSLKFAMPPVAQVRFFPSLFVLSEASEATKMRVLMICVMQPSAWLRAATDDNANPNCPIKIAHGTTTLAFRFQGGIIVATDSRATAGNWIASQTVKKVIEINNCLLGTMAGGAAVRSPSINTTATA
jgi:20S proteasome subunit beta 5